MKKLNLVSVALLLVAAAHSVSAETALPEQVIAAPNKQVQESLHNAIDDIMTRSLKKHQVSDGSDVVENKGIVSVEEIVTVQPVASNWSELLSNGLTSKYQNVLLREDDGNWKIIFQSLN